MRIKRCLSFLIAIAILAGDALAVVPAYAAPGPQVEGGAALSFPDSADPLATSIVSGGGVRLKVVKPSGYLPHEGSSNGLKMLWNGSTNLAAAQGLNISGENNELTVNVDPKFFTINKDNFKGTDPVNVAISGSYDALLSSGTVTETVNAGPPCFSSFTITPLQTVFKTTSFTLSCNAPETDSGQPGFSISSTSDVFKNYDSVYVQPRTSDTQPLVVRVMDMQGGTNTPSFQITFTPSTVYTLINDETGQKYQNKRVQVGAVFNFTMPEPNSNQVFLNIYSPKAAVLDIQTDMQKFIQLADGDAMNYIRSNFKVEYSHTRFNSPFSFRWKWVPDDAADPNKQEIVYFNDKPHGTQEVEVRPMYYDVPGRLEVTATYGRDPDNEEVLALKPVSLPIIIKGTGDPASLERVSQWVTTENPDTHVRTVAEQSFNTSPGDDDTKMPAKIQLNAYDGTVPGTKIPAEPSKYKIKLNMGKDNGASQFAVVECLSGDPGIVTMQTEIENKTADYSFKGQIANPKINYNAEGTANLVFIPAKTGKRTVQEIRVQVTFYVLDSKGKPVKAITQPEAFTLAIKDESPSDDATLQSLVMKGRKKDGGLLSTWPVVEYGFNPKTTDYNIQLNYQYDAIQLTPTKNDSFGSRVIKMKAKYADGAYIEGWGPTVGFSGTDYYKELQSASVSDVIPLEVNRLATIEVVVTAENTQTKTYRLNVLRKPQGTDSTLKSLTLADEDGKVLFNGVQKNQFIYDVEIPFKVQKAKVSYELSDPAAPKLSPADSFTPALQKNGVFSEAVWLNILEGCAGSEGSRSMTFTVKTKAEDGKTESTYIFNMKRAEPSNDNTLKELKVLDAVNSDKPLSYTPAFHSDMAKGDFYEVRIPYSIGKLKISARSSHPGATMILLAKGIDGSSIPGTETDKGGKGWVKLTSSTPSKAFVPAPFQPENEDKTYDNAVIEVWPESLLPPSGTSRPGPGDTGYEDYITKVMKYPVHIYRNPANSDATLKSVLLTDQDKKPVEFLDFDPEKTEYILSVPYETNKLQITPTATDANVFKILVKGRKVISGQASSLIPLEEKSTQIPIEVWAEDQTAKTYTLMIIRQDPSSDARLAKLEITDLQELSPLFVPSKTSYGAKLSEGAQGVKVTAAPNNPGARITIDGKRVENGKQTELLRILEVKQTMQIVVTAQDGKTTMTYTIEFCNENLIEKTDNADLKSLKIRPGEMRPVSFKPSVTEYEVAVEEDTFDVELVPKAADPLASVKVFYDSKEIGDDKGNFASFVAEGENEFTIEVTSSDKSKVKEYVVRVYRNEEDKMGVLKPLHGSDIDFKNSSDVILVDITKYSRIARDVFVELQKYPNKSIIFEGNDYSLQFAGKNLNKVIPVTEYYDFGLSFASPLESDIWYEVDSYKGNEDAKLVFVYFKYHGELPGPAVLTMSLGGKYKSRTLTWNYYNEERERLDYYGNIRTNTRGTFSVILKHMSTYVVADQRLAGSENKNTGGGASGPDLGLESEANKLLPNTGAERRLK